MNWWIGIIFAVGSLLFAAGSILFLAPAIASACGLDATGINAVFFAGSVPFTTAAFLQLYQAANAPDFPPSDPEEPRPRRIFGWRPHDLGWVSCALQFPGTLLFNLNTFDPFFSGLGWLGQDVLIWVPDFVGSILFLLSGYLAFAETCHSFWRWDFADLSWWVTFANLLGCIAFMISACFAFVPPQPPGIDLAAIATTFTLLGAIGFFVGSALMLPEAA